MRTGDLIQAAGGLKPSADNNLADLTRYAASGGGSEHLEISLASLVNGNPTEDVPLKRGDVLAIRQVPGWKDVGASVKVSGEVMHPSTYGIKPGENSVRFLPVPGATRPMPTLTEHSLLAATCGRLNARINKT